MCASAKLQNCKIAHTCTKWDVLQYHGTRVRTRVLHVYHGTMGRIAIRTRGRTYVRVRTRVPYLVDIVPVGSGDSRGSPRR